MAAISNLPISRTFVEGTWLKILRYQCTIGVVEKVRARLIPLSRVIRDRRGRTMLGRKERDQLELLITGSLARYGSSFLMTLCWCASIVFSTFLGLRDEVADLYCLDDGRPGIDPEVAVRLMLAGLLSGIAHDRKLMREAHVIRWFIGYGVHDRLPDHSSLTRAIWPSRRLSPALGRR